MLEKSHVEFGITSALAASVLMYNAGVPLDKVTVGVITASAALGSLLPDIDMPQSTIGRVFKPLASLLEKKCGHRTITHDVLIMVPLFIISIFVKNPIFFGIMLGVIGHLFLDSMTTMGVCFNYFSHRKDFKDGWGRLGIGYIHVIPEALTFKSRSWRAKFVTIFFCLINVYIVLVNMPNILQ